jgi:hypothetical protein
MEDIEQQPPPAAGAGQAPPHTHQQLVKLPGFWTEDPVSWFRLAEGQFALRNVTDPVARYYHVLASLSQDAVRLVRHVLHEDTGPLSYDNLRTSLASHSLSNYQKMERMMRLPPLGDRKPSVMLAEMLEFCPAGESSTAVFAYLFLQRLPREIRVLLSEDDPADMRAIADKADRLIAMHVPQGHDACATVSLEDDDGDLVAAMGSEKRRKKFLVSKRQGQQQQASAERQGGSSRRGADRAASPRTSMCYYHAKFGERAKYCQEGCLWPEN